MSDPAFVAAGYAVVLGGLSLYVVSMARRVRGVRRTVKALERAREKNRSGPPGDPEGTLAGTPSEGRR